MHSHKQTKKRFWLATWLVSLLTRRATFKSTKVLLPNHVFATVLLVLLAIVNTTHARSFRHFQEIPVAPKVNTGNPAQAQSNAPQSLVAQVTAGDDLANILLGNQLNQQRANAVNLMLGSNPNATSVAALLNARPKPDRQRIQQALEQVLVAWNSGSLQHYLATDFYDGHRLSQNLAQRIPQDAKLKLMQLEGYQLLKDEMVTTRNQEHARAWLASVDAVTQIEFNDPLAGFVQLRGKQRFTLRLFDFADIANK